MSTRFIYYTFCKALCKFLPNYNTIFARPISNQGYLAQNKDTGQLLQLVFQHFSINCLNHSGTVLGKTLQHNVSYTSEEKI